MNTARFIGMTKRLLVLMGIVGFFLISTLTLSQANESPKPTDATPTSSVTDDKKVQQLKEKLATKVAELRESQKRGFFGEIAAVAKTSFTLVTNKGEVKVRFTEDTLIYKSGKPKTEAKVAELKNGLTGTVIGMYEEEAKTVTAKIILLQNQSKFTNGEITIIDKDNAALTLKTPDAEGQIVDYEKNTEAAEVNVTDKKISKSGLSRISVGDHILVWGVPAEDDPKKISAVRILRLPKELFKSDAISTPAASIAASASASPKVSTRPSATPKGTPKATPRTSPKASPKATPQP
jgi:hypothetical protein